jgi:hypothetical protein
LRWPTIDPVISVLVFVVVGTLVVWGLIVWAGPGRPSDVVVLLSVSAPIAVALAFGFFLYKTSPNEPVPPSDEAEEPPESAPEVVTKERPSDRRSRRRKRAKGRDSR